MKKRNHICVSILCFSMCMNAQVQEKEEFKMNVQKSVLKWQGSSLFSFGEHYGEVQFKNGYVTTVDDRVIGGTFFIDMNTIINTDGDYNEDLVSHLKNEDFFDVKNHPTAQLKMTRVEYINDVDVFVHADLTIRGIIQSITYDAKIHRDKAEMVARLIIDRTRWNILYNTKVTTTIKNSILSDAIEFDVTLRF